jgi:hypothetical protein
VRVLLCHPDTSGGWLPGGPEQKEGEGRGKKRKEKRKGKRARIHAYQLYRKQVAKMTVNVPS